MKTSGEKIEIAVTGNSWMKKGIGSIQSLMKDTFSKAKNEVVIVAYAIGENQEFIKMMEDMLICGIRVSIIVNKFHDQPENVQKILKGMCFKYNNFLLFSFEPVNNLEDLHAKIIVVDHSYALVGSANLSGRGLFRNHELMIKLSGKTAAEIGSLVDTLMKSSNACRIKS